MQPLSDASDEGGKGIHVEDTSAVTNAMSFHLNGESVIHAAFFIAT